VVVVVKDSAAMATDEAYFEVVTMKESVNIRLLYTLVLIYHVN